MKIDAYPIIFISVAWLVYFILHSILASNNIKNRFNTRFPGLAPCYRLGYNLIAIFGLIPIVILHIQYQGPLVIEWVTFSWLKPFLIGSAIAGFIWSLRYYDLSEFSGINQCRNNKTTNSHFIISPLHRYVRHPWYFFALLIIWSRDLDLMQLASATLMSSYFMIGSRFEERKLCQEYGDTYKEYISKVPALIPVPWKRIKRAESEALINNQTRNKH